MSVLLQADNAMMTDFGMIRAWKLITTTTPSSLINGMVRSLISVPSSGYGIVLRC